MNRILTGLAFAILFSNLAAAQSTLRMSDQYPGDEVTLLGPGVVSTLMEEYSPTFDARRNELFFMRRTPGEFDYTLYSCRLTPQGWSVPEVLPFSGSYRDAAPCMSPDGESLFFDSRRPSALGSEDIDLWVARRQGSVWSDPVLLENASRNTSGELEAGRQDFGPAVDASGNLYFYSFRQPYRGGARYRASGSSYEIITLDDAIPDPSFATFVSYLALSPDGHLALMEGGAPNRRDTDLYYACRNDDGSWTEARPIPGVNTTDGEGGPSLTPDGKFLLFTSDRPSDDPSARGANLYLVSADRLFPDCGHQR
jgi:Tol biopolymer transport system component